MRKSSFLVYNFIVFMLVHIYFNLHNSIHCFQCRLFHFCVLDICSKQTAQFTSMYWIFISGQQPYILRSIYWIFFYLQMDRAFPVVFFVHRNIGLMVSSPVSQAGDPSSDPTYCLKKKNLFYQIFLVDGPRNFGSFQRCILPEFRSPSTGKTAPEKKRQYTFCTATLRSICRNYQVNLKQCSTAQCTMYIQTVLKASGQLEREKI